MTTNEVWLTEACRKLKGFINTGIAGLWTQAIDRLRAAGIDTSRFQASIDSAEQLLGHLHAHYTIA